MGSGDNQTCIYGGFDDDLMARRNCKHSGLADTPMARRNCIGRGVWGSVEYCECFTQITRMYQDFIDVRYGLNMLHIDHTFCRAAFIFSSQLHLR